MCTSSDSLSSDNGAGGIMEMIMCLSSDALSSDNGARGIYGDDNVFVFRCSLISQQGRGHLWR